MAKPSTSLAFVDDFSQGLRTDTGADRIPPGSLARAENVRLLPTGGFAIRGGTEEVTVWAPGTSAKILNLAVMRELDILICQSGTKILVAKDEDSPLYTVGLTLTAARCDFEEYDQCVKYSNGSDAYGSICLAKVKTQFTNSDTRIVLEDGYGSKFTASGTAYCKGQSITYTKAIGPTRAQTFTANAGTDTFTCNAHGLANADRVITTNSGGALPAGLNSGATYYVISAAANTFQLSLTAGGSAIDVTDAGTGTHSIYPQLDALTGCTIPSGTYAVGEIVTQTSTPSGAPKATVLESQFEKMMGAGVTTAGHAIYYSRTASTANPEYVDDFTGSGASSELFGKYGKIKAMESLLTKMYVAKDKGIEAWTGIDSNGIPVREPFTDAYGVWNPLCMVVMGDKIAMYTTQRRFRTIEPDSTGANPEPVINPYFDRKVRGTMQALDEDQDDACMGYNEHDELLRATVLEDSSRKTVLYDALAGGFTVDTGYVPSCWVEYRGGMYFGSAVTDKIYRAEAGYTDGGVAPRMDVLTPVHYVGDRRRKVPVQEVYLTGLIGAATEATVEIYCDGALHRSFTLEGDADYVSRTTARPLGREFLGRDPLGHSGGEDSALGFEFSVPIGVNLECRTVQIRFTCQGTGYRVQINSYEIVIGEASASDDTQEDIW